ncbi:MAG: SDR family oxidoreductase [Holosporaceae bacterium]|jgi:NAD(P)-dependent dehydrogenase (short-subunit alcohol dehydrogenase family)|nr:SDR family oxidoreductase [Holosporaceae bacterium]
MLVNLSEKIAVVTGGAGNIGPHLVKSLYDSGAIVYVLLKPGTSNDHSLEMLKNITGIYFLECDILDFDELTNVSSILNKKHGQLDLLVANAGIDAPPPANSDYNNNGKINFYDPLEFSKIINVNLCGTFNTLIAFGKLMEHRGGSIILMGSLYSMVSPDPSFYSHIIPEFIKSPAYSASKAGIAQLGRFFAAHWGKYKISINTLSPGGVAGKQDVKFVEKYINRVPMKRMCCCADICNAILFLASESSRYITGINLFLDGGFSSM